MKKIIAVVAAVVGFGVSVKVKEAAAVSIIGGPLIGAIFVGIVLVVAGVVIYRKVRNK